MKKVIYVDSLSHHGVKGMKWGVRKADYSTSGMESKDIYDRLEDLDSQERSARFDNHSNYNRVKKDLKASLTNKREKREISRKEYRELKKQGLSEAKRILKENDVVIRKNFNKAYYDKIGSGELATARIKHEMDTQRIDSLMRNPNYREDWDMYAEEHRQRGYYLDEAETRRAEYLSDTAEHRKKK